MILKKNDTSYGYTHLQSETVGPGAAELVWDLVSKFEQTDTESVTCHINAVFDRTLHLSPFVHNEDDGPSLLVVGTRDVREGPLLINIDTPLGFSFQRLVNDQQISVTAQPLGHSDSVGGVRFQLGQRGILDVDTDVIPTLPAGGGVYKNVPLHQFAASGTCLKTHNCLIDRLSADNIEDGLGLFNQLLLYRRGQSASELEALATSVADWIVGSPTDTNGNNDRAMEKGRDTERRGVVIPDIMANLVGRGPGATPSGDDFFAGLILPLQLVNDDSVSRQVHRLSCRLTELATGESTQVSAALLAQAVQSRAARPVTDCLKTLLTRSVDVETAYQNATKLTTIGHTSGVDTLVGMLTATTMVYPLLVARQ